MILTRRQKEVWDYLEDYIAAHGYAPTLRLQRRHDEHLLRRRHTPEDAVLPHDLADIGRGGQFRHCPERVVDLGRDPHEAPFFPSQLRGCERS